MHDSLLDTSFKGARLGSNCVWVPDPIVKRKM